MPFKSILENANNCDSLANCARDSNMAELTEILGTKSIEELNSDKRWNQGDLNNLQLCRLWI